MSTTVLDRPPATGSWRTFVRGLGWTFIGSGLLILLFVIYLLWFTNFETERTQNQLADQWFEQVGTDLRDVTRSTAQPGPTPSTPSQPSVVDIDVEVGDAYAAMWFTDPDQRALKVTEDPLLVVEGVSLDVLRRGPGHYPDSPDPGHVGNFSVAGHRTTYGGPFGELDTLNPGDLIHVQDRSGAIWQYEVDAQEIISPTRTEVVEDRTDGDGRAVLTLTTCHPRFSAAQRLVVYATLVEDQEPIRG